MRTVDALFVRLAVASSLSIPLAVIYRPLGYITCVLSAAAIFVGIRSYLDRTFRDGWREAAGYYDDLVGRHLDPAVRAEAYAMVVGQPLTRRQWRASMTALMHDLGRAESDSDCATAYDLHRRRLRGEL